MESKGRIGDGPALCCTQSSHRISRWSKVPAIAGIEPLTAFDPSPTLNFQCTEITGKTLIQTEDDTPTATIIVMFEKFEDVFVIFIIYIYIIVLIFLLHDGEFH